MKYKIKLLIAFIITVMSTYGAKKVTLLDDINSSTVDINPNKKENVLVGTDEVEVDLINNTLISKDGINVKQGNLELKTFSLKRDTEKNKIFVKGKLETLLINPTGDLRVESLDGGEVSLNGNEGIFYNNFASLEVGKVTGAVKPNDKIYFGGEKIEYKDNVISINNGWFTTDYKIQSTKQPKDAGYFLLSKNIKIEPDKQVTLTGTDLFTDNKKRTPFSFPWFRTNIRKDSKVPLFPEWGTSNYYGWNTTVGVLYGNKGDKFVGGIAPKFADRMGFLIGRWENWYKTDKYGTAKLNIDDWLIWAKEKRNDKLANFNTTSTSATDKLHKDYVDNQERAKRYRVNYTHEYNGDKGNLYLNATRATYNMVPKLDDVIVSGINNNKFTKDVPKLVNSIGFYSLDSDLQNLGLNKDITLKSKVKLTSNKQVYGLMVYDDIKDIAYGSSVDNDLYSQVELYKDNKNYRLGGYYNYLYDMDPGSTFKDTRSRAEDFGFEFLDKENKIGFSYDEKNGDKFRKLGLWERNPNNEPKVSGGVYGDAFNYNYTPTMVKEYDELNTKDLRISFGEYEVTKDYKIKLGYDLKSEIKKLNLTEDSSRSSVKTPRSKQYNRFENIIYSNFKEEKGYAELFDSTTKFTIAAGKMQDEFWDRNGIYSKDGYQKYVNDSDFYEIGAEKNEISLDRFGQLALFGGVRYDKYKRGYDPIKNIYSTGHDSTIRTQLRANHVVELFNNSNNKDRSFDFRMLNDLKVFYQRYDYNSGDIKYGNLADTKKSKAIRMTNKENIYQVTDTVSTEIGNTTTVYTIDYKHGENPASKNRTNQVIKNRLDFKVDDKKTLELEINQDKKYTDKTLTGKNYNNFTHGQYQVAYYLGNHKLSYQYNTIDSKILDIDTKLIQNKKVSSDSKEKIRLNTYAYGYNSDNLKFGLDYSEGTDRRYSYSKTTSKKEELNIENRIYGVSLAHGDDDINHTYRGTYETYKNANKNKEKIDNREYNMDNSDIISFNYEYKNRNFSEEELKKYAELEYNKDSTSLTTGEVNRIRDILRARERNQIDFKLNNNNYSKLDDMGDYKYNFKFNVMLKRNEARYKLTNNYWKSLEKIKLGVLYSQNRVGFGYNVEENSGWSSKTWNKKNREHKVSLLARIGKPSQGWSVKTYAKFYEDLSNKNTPTRYRKNSLDGLGVEIAKEMGYYQWSVAFEREYVNSVRDYQWKTAIQFTLLTFPEKPIFGIGANTNTNKHTKPQTYLFDGMKVNKIID